MGSHPTVFAFNTGDGTVSLIDPETDSLLGTRSMGFSSSFPPNQYTPEPTSDPNDPLWLNVGRGIRGVTAGSLSEVPAAETGSSANRLEQTPDGDHLVVSAREPAHRQFRVDADPDSDTFGDVTGEIDRQSKWTDGDGPCPCDVTIHPEGGYAHVPDIFGDTLTVLSVDPFEIVTRIDVDPVGDGPGRRPLTSEIGPDSEVGHVFTPVSDDGPVVDLAEGVVSGRIDRGGSAFVGTWNPSRTKLYVPVQTTDEVAVIDTGSERVVERIGVGSAPYGATAARVRPDGSSAPSMAVAVARLGLTSEHVETTCGIGNCDCGYRL